jgi:hypothetical protein
MVVTDSLLHGGPQVRFADREDAKLGSEAIFKLGLPRWARRIPSGGATTPWWETRHTSPAKTPFCERSIDSVQSAAGKYALAGAFTERFFQLAETRRVRWDDQRQQLQ